MKSWRVSLGVVLLSVAAGISAQESAPIYGRELMTEQERLEYRERMRNAGSPEAQQQLRLEHHEKMHERARERGVSLPEAPPADRGPGSGQGQGKGKGQGQGKAKGQGGRYGTNAGGGNGR